jgi:Ca2+-binding RTX toxin-like protein
MFIRVGSARPRALRVGVATGASFLAICGFAAEQTLAGEPASVKARVQNGTLQITGTPGADKLVLRLEPGNPNALDVDVGDDGTVDFSFDRGTFGAISAQGGAGDDEIRVDESQGAFTDDLITLDGGAGDDTLAGGSGSDVLDGGSGDDVLRGGDGDDVLTGGPGNDQVDGGRGSDTASLGAGDDRFTWDPGDGSDAVDGGAGNDRLVFDGSNAPEHMELSADSSHVHLFRDVGNVTMDLSTIETAAVNASGAADTITVDDLTGTGLKTAAVDLGATPGGPGDGQPDSVIVNGTDHADHVHLSTTAGNVLVSGLAPQIQIAGAEATNDTLNVNTLAGDDTAAVASGVSGVILPVIDLGTDQ